MTEKRGVKWDISQAHVSGPCSSYLAQRENKRAGRFCQEAIFDNNRVSTGSFFPRGEQMTNLSEPQKLCFVIQPTGPEWRDYVEQVFEFIIAEAVESQGYTPIRADQVS